MTDQTSPIHRVHLGDLEVSPIGFGGMALSHVYGGGITDAEARSTLDTAIDAGITLIDTADVYGAPRPDHAGGPSGTNEEMLAPLLRRRRDDVEIATKFGLTSDPQDGKDQADGDTSGASFTGVNGRPEYARSAVDASLRRLGLDTIDLYYLHRPDPNVPVEDTVAAMAELVAEGKVRHLGLSEVTAEELRRAHAVHPITAVQSEWSLWSRDVENHVLPACSELGIGFVPYSPLGRGFLTGTLTAETVAQDFRGSTSRMRKGAWDTNQQALTVVKEVASEVSSTVDSMVSPSQVALAWLVAKGCQFDVPTVPIPGSRRADRMIENLVGARLELSDEHVIRLDSVADLVTGSRNINDNPRWISSGRE